MEDYTYDPQPYGELISWGYGEFYHFDALGSARQITNASQTLLTTYRWQAFGDLPVRLPAEKRRFQWKGQLGYSHDYAPGTTPDFPYYWVRARFYDPDLGRWISRDPARQGSNWYTYVHNRPVSLTDPSGLAELGDDEGPGWTARAEGEQWPCGPKVYTYGNRFPRGASRYASCVRRYWPNYISALRAKCADCRRQCEGTTLEQPTPTAEEMYSYAEEHPLLPRPGRPQPPPGPGTPFMRGIQAHEAGNKWPSADSPAAAVPPGVIQVYVRKGVVNVCITACMRRSVHPGPWLSPLLIKEPTSWINAWDEVARHCGPCPGSAHAARV